METKNKYLFPVEMNKSVKITYNQSPAHVGFLINAVDFIVPVGTPIKAALDGTVVDIKQDSNQGGISQDFDEFGNYIELEHENEEYSICEHIKQNGSVVHVGDKVKAGQLIGYSGATGWIAQLGPHLHFDVHKYFGSNKNEYATLEICWKKEENKRLVFGSPHEGAEVRMTVSAVIQRKSDGKFLIMKWNKFDWIAPSVGGIEKGETPEEAAVREVFEETGYKTRAVKKLGAVIESHFFAENKGIWRHRIDQPVLLELLSEEPEKVSQEESKLHVVVWMSKEEALKKMTHVENKCGLCRYLGIKEPDARKLKSTDKV